MKLLGFFFALALMDATAGPVIWVSGVVVLQDETVKVGELSPQAGELVLFREKNGVVSAYAAHHVLSFRFYDAKENINRVFVSRANSPSYSKAYHFYECVATGFLSVFRKPRASYFVNAEKYGDDFIYYVAWNDRWLSLTQFRQDIFPFIRQQSRKLPALKDGLAVLNPNQRDQALKMIILFNQNYASASVAGI